MMEGRNLYFKDFKSHGESSVRVLPRLQYIYIYMAKTPCHDKFSPRRITWQLHKTAIKRRDDVSMAKVTAINYVTRAKNVFLWF